MVALARESRYFVRSVASAAGKRWVFFWDSKGDVTQFFGARFAWHVLEEGVFSMASYKIFRRSKGTLGFCRAVCFRRFRS